MRTVRRRFEESLALQLALVFLLGLGAAKLVRPHQGVLVWLLNAVLYTTVAGCVLWYRARKDSRTLGTDRKGLVAAEHRLRKGEVPDDPAERAQLRRLVAERERQMGRTRWMVPVLVAMVALPVALAARAGSWTLALLALAGALGVAAAVVLMRRKAVRTVRRTARALDAADAADAPPPADARGEDAHRTAR
ncbi:hypothetical protein V1J52_14330 [Streptomyces sp. TRM 70351]|uniref:hypothetical protein n=1 Tax=Streptomyces sp. TRM 70351 TaxID=3116552 RepID=UPI002E7C2EA1|nr:hypothetical protein [Streptomyces sp. TRM 70351]MEE1929343.1 hypothetical protein [Streptomyces sp. TRM 70351]